jgi:hypothetical protein
LWEAVEYLAFIRANSAELATAYRDTIGDLLLSLSGSFTAAVLLATVLWGASKPGGPSSGQAARHRRSRAAPDMMSTSWLSASVPGG